ncbi:hypothetical protein NESM_000757300 [Novymonas esmeraldas]|uniref:Uncharacterized protein n=1 Tax=Novymonas esmeraldas TaxID=1808958 RepID=A0AAW0EX63_9TRYP
MPDSVPGVVHARPSSHFDTLPGTLGKVSVCAAITLGIAAYVSLRNWLAKRAAEEKAVALTKGGQSKGTVKETRASAGAAVRPNSDNHDSSEVMAPPGSSDALGAGGRATVAAGAASLPPPASQPQLPARNYFTARAAMHVRRHSAKLMEWYDAQLGVQLPFSPLYFELKQEERQAPLILLTFRTVREPTHRMAVTIEELYESQTAATYCSASIARITDCAKMLGQTSVRIGGKDYPAAEYCYVDEHQAMNYVFSAFATHARLAVTVQYVAPTRVRSILPTATYDLLRCLTFTAPSPSPSYLLVSEPRLGLGYHLPLDFLVHEGLAESDGVEDRLFTSPATTAADGDSAALYRLQQQQQQQQQQHTRGAAAAAAGVDGGAVYPPYRRPPYSYLSHDSGGAGGGGGVEDDGVWMAPYATAMSHGGRRMGLITSYEPTGGTTTAAASALVVDPAGTAGTGGGGVPHAWRPYLEQQVCRAARQLGLVLGGGGGGDARAPRVVFRAPDAAHSAPRQTVLVEPYPLTIALNGNFSTGYDAREDDGDAVVHVTAFSLFREVRVDVNSAYLTLVPDALDTTAAGAGAARSRSSAQAADASAAGTVRAFWSAFYVPVGTACVSFHFIASSLRHTSTEFVSFCASVMNSVSLGNHHGQSVSVLYCNTRHNVLPFRLSLPPTGMATVEEPMLSDPLCVVQATHGVEQISVTVRVFPLFASSTTTTAAAAAAGDGGEAGGPSSRAVAAAPTDGRPPAPSKALPPRPLAERRGTRHRHLFRQLQYMVRHHLAQFPGGVHVVSHERTTMNAMPAIRVCFTPLWYAGDAATAGGGGGGSAVPPSSSVGGWDDLGGGSSQLTADWAGARDAMLEEEVGQLNPFAQYFPPPPPPASYLWGQPPPPASPASPGTAGKATGAAVTAAALRRAAAGGAVEAEARADVEGDHPAYGLRGEESQQRSQEEIGDPLRVAVAVCCEGNAFLFQASASEYTMGMAVQAVQALAIYLAPIPRGN